MTPDRLLTIEDLAHRWSLDRDAVVRLVREAKVPFIPLRAVRPGDMRVNWARARFASSAIERWESGQLREFGEPAGREPAVVRDGKQWWAD
jgi:hypothetical protein